ncbi:MAG: Flp pilus assembly protein CpaB [Clostridiales bacterium]|nr:Flp pilus assembly protein CpaB [Clostridiales bacterium]
MKKSSKGLFVLAFLLALIGAGTLYIYLSQLEEPQQVSLETTSVLVASVNIPSRTMITDEMVKVVNMPNEGVIEGSILTSEDIVGKYTRTEIFENQQINPNALIEDISEVLSMKISGSNRAVSISVTGSTGVSKLLEPGDRVDVIVFLPQIQEQARIVRPDIAKIMLQNIEVLAIDRTLTRKEGTPDLPAEEGQVSSYMVTLSVPVMDVETLILAKDIGLIDLALRPLEDDFIYTTSGVIWQELLLNDTKQLKDFFPEYEFEGLDEGVLEPGEFVYSKYLYYTVEFGDTLLIISNKFYGTPAYVQLLKQVNKIDDENMILAGTGIKIPVLEEGGVENAD